MSKLGLTVLTSIMAKEMEVDSRKGILLNAVSFISYLITGIFRNIKFSHDDAKKNDAKKNDAKKLSDLFPKNYAESRKLSVAKYRPSKITKLS
jgi:hypothetical protein